MKTLSFSDWLVQAFELANKRPLLWLGTVLFLAVFLPISRVSLALGILFSISSLFIGVGIVAYIHQGTGTLWNVIQRQIPLAFTLAGILMIFWFTFRVVANIYSGEIEKIAQFFFHWELTADNFQDKAFRQLIIWFYSSAIVALIFVLLMLNSFGSWFSYPLICFKQHSWGEARDLGKQAFTENAGAMYKLMGFLLLTAFVGIGLVPLLTPLFYMLVSTLMYVSYYDIFERSAPGN
ncbi:MAG: hypothetical protein KAJ63_15085 [Methyloprofundus sp.]|nr:hypothetical protein [Methyloprofundus sp.]